MKPDKSTAPKDPGPYVLISPVRDELATIQCMLASVLAQSVLPLRWAILDDGSRDGTQHLLENAAAQYPFIQVLRLSDRGERQPGPGVVAAFFQGLKTLAELPWGFVGKLDGDVQVPCQYYETVLKAFQNDPKLGIASGVCLTPYRNGFRLEKNQPEHTRGPCKVYRRECLDQIGGLQPTLGWDGLDGYMARLQGWHTQSFPDLKVLHLRPTHSGEGFLRGFIRAGRGAYFMHYRPVYLLARAVGHLFRPPFGIASLGMLLGFVQAHLQRAPRDLDLRLIDFIHQEQAERLKRIFWRG